MNNLEHYFENLLFYGKDTSNNINKNALSKEEQSAVEECYSYILHTVFESDKEALQKWIRGK